jgi:hypothetical protein
LGAEAKSALNVVAHDSRRRPIEVLGGGYAVDGASRVVVAVASNAEVLVAGRLA